MNLPEPLQLTHWMARPRVATKQECERVRLHAKYWRDPEHAKAQAREYYRRHREKILERKRVVALTPERIDTLRIRSCDKYRKRRDAICAKQRKAYWKHRDALNAARRSRRLARAILADMLSRLS